MSAQFDNEQQLITSYQYRLDLSQNTINPSSQNYEVSIHQYNNQVNEPPSYNIADISKPSTEKILNNLQDLFMKEWIYIDLGFKNLISLNPYKDTPHLSDQQIQDCKINYQNNKNLDDKNTPPHLFKLAESAKQECFSPNNNSKTSSIIIQGISGAGKTVASNGILSYISAESQSGLFKSTVLSKVDIEKRITATNIIYEAYGNAKTMNNSNSSRFGKMISIQFDQQGKISNGKIITSLFERTRVIQQGYMERNYHIFYWLQTAYQRIQELEAFAQQAEKNVEYEIVKLVEEIQKLKLDTNFAIFGTQNQNTQSLDDTNLEILNQANQDFENFKQLLLAFGVLDFSLEEIISIFQCLAGLIHLYEENYNQSQEFLKIKDLQGTINSKINSQQSRRIQAESIINGIVMDFYYKLFCWIQNKINQKLSSENDQNQKYTLNIFDSFGLEIIENTYGIQQNQLEQLMLNYINEKIQNSFYTQIIDNAKKLFISEKLTPTIVNFQKNDKIIELFEKVIFASLKDCHSLQANTLRLKEIITQQTQEKGLQDFFIQESQLQQKRENLTQSQIQHQHKQNIIGIKHTGGEIYYLVDSFISRNKYSVSENLQNINQESENKIIKSFTLQSQDQTVADDTQNVTNNLISIFQKSDTFFVKCFSTNYEQKADYFDRNAIQIQLRQSGIEQSAQFLYQSYFLSIPKQEFLNKCQSVYPKIKNEQDLQEFINQQNNVDLTYFGSNNILIKERLKRILDDNLQQHLQVIAYEEPHNIVDNKLDEIKNNFQNTIKLLNENLKVVEKECEFQRKRADIFQLANEQIMTIMESQKINFQQNMAQIKQIQELCRSEIQNLRQPDQQENYEQQTIFQFGQIQ